MTNRALGKTQKGVLKALISHGSYHAGCGWCWSTHKGTVKVLETLVKKGLVSADEREVTRTLSIYPRTITETQFTITDAGREMLANAT